MNLPNFVYRLSPIHEEIVEYKLTDAGRTLLTINQVLEEIDCDDYAAEEIFKQVDDWPTVREDSSE